MTEKIELDHDSAKKLFGVYDANVKLIEEKLKVRIKTRDGGITVTGGAEDSDKAVGLITALLGLIKNGGEPGRADVLRCLDLAEGDKPDEINALNSDVVALNCRGRPVKCKTVGQRAYVNAIRENQLVFGVGPAGTGKTYLAVALAAAAYKKGEAERIVLTRPAIEAGEKLGFLPGDLQTKVDPYLRPLYDALDEMFGTEAYLRLIERGVIEVAPLAYMRGRTLSGAFIILDEAQNTTAEQMKMFLTRIGEGSKIVVTGDGTQVDLPAGKTSGLKNALEILSGIEGIRAIKLTERDVIRSELVRRIVAAYDSAGGLNED